MTSSAPIERTSSTYDVPHTPVTWAPNPFAICTANDPTPPDAPITNTRCSAWTLPASRRPWRAAQPVVGTVAQVGLVKGELLTRGQVGPRSGFTAGQQLVALPLKEGQFPARGLTAGQKVLIVATPGAAAAAGSGGRSSSAPAAPGVSGTVAEVGSMNQATQITVVDVQVSADSGVAVAQLASTGNLAVILLPAGR